MLVACKEWHLPGLAVIAPAFGTMCWSCDMPASALGLVQIPE